MLCDGQQRQQYVDGDQCDGSQGWSVDHCLQQAGILTASGRTNYDYQAREISAINGLDGHDLHGLDHDGRRRHGRYHFGYRHTWPLMVVCSIS